MGNGEMAKRMEEAGSYGVMEPFTKGIGKMIWLMEEVDLSKPVEMSMKESGSMTKQKEKESTSTKMALPTQVNGSTTSSMAMAIRNGLTEHSMRATM